MPKKTSPLKDEAQKLYRKGFSTKEIAEKLKKPLRSVQRWIQQVNAESGNQRSPKTSNIESNFSFKIEPPTSEQELTFPDVKDSSAKKYLTDVRFLANPECVSFDLNLLKWESFSYNRAIYCQAFQKLSDELAKDEESLSLNRAKTLSNIMTKHFEIVEKSQKVFDINWALDVLVKLGYAVIAESELKELINKQEFDSFHILRHEK